MILLFYLVLSLISSAVLATPVTNGQKDCKKHLTKMDQCVSKILIITNNELDRFESKEALVKNYCEPFPSWLKCVSEYKFCLKSFQRTLFSMVVANFKKTHSQFCKTSNSTASAYRHARCINPDTREVFLRIGDRLVGMADHVAERPNINEVIPALCCGSRILINTTESKVNEICKNISAPDTGTFLSGIISSTLGDVLDLLCAKYPTVQSCYDQENTLTVELANLIENQNVTSRMVMGSMLRLLQRLDTANVPE